MFVNQHWVFLTCDPLVYMENFVYYFRKSNYIWMQTFQVQVMLHCLDQFWYHQLFFLQSLKSSPVGVVHYMVSWLIQCQIHFLNVCLGWRVDIPYVLECFIRHSYFKAVSILRAAVQMNHSHFCCLKWRATFPHFLAIHE